MKSAHTITNIPAIPGAKIAIIQSKWHQNLTDSMIKKCCEILRMSQCDQPTVHILPGSLELPIAAQTLARIDKKLEAIIAFGIIVKGDTDHYEVVKTECMRGLSTVSLQEQIPIINEILPVHDIQHAISRCADDEFNKGIEAAIAAAQIIAWRRERTGNNVHRNS